MDSVRIYYNDGFDEREYPLQDWHSETITKIHHCFGFADDLSWEYEATIHGRVFSITTRQAQPRLHTEELQFLSDLPGFRWIEAEERKLTIGLTHNLPQKG